MLHHAYTYDFEKMIFLIGDVNSNLIHADIMCFAEEDKSEYGNVLTDIFDKTLLWAYPEELFDENLNTEV